jgi:hypothetical protein
LENREVGFMKVGRFQVMVILQAARAKDLGLPASRAKSWGLNRAIFYAAAKRGFKHPVQPVGRGGVGKRPVARPGKTYFLGDEMAYTAKKSNRIYFTIGGELQTEGDFKRQIEGRFGKHFGDAWKESLAIVRQFSKDVLLSQNRFFSEVYRPRRDELASKWTELSE